MTEVVNMHGVTIRRGCCSCQHKGIEADGTRVCTWMMLKVRSDFCCGLWQMAYNLKKLRVK